MTSASATRERPSSPRAWWSRVASWRWPGSVAVVLLLLSALDLWWLTRFRRGFPLDIDESGYLWFSFSLRDALGDHGLSGLWHGFQHEGWVGPLLPAVTALVGFLGGGKQIVASLAVQLVFFAVLVFASYGIGSRLHGPGAGALTAVAVATVPAVTDFVRTYHLVIPSTAMLTFSVFALLASRRLRHRGWTIAWGVGMGLALLARSMMLAFVPAVAVAGVWIALVDRARDRRLANLALGLAAFTGTSLLWYATSWHPILSYLLRAGYGQQSLQYGPDLSPLSRAYWTHEPTGAVQFALYLPLAAVLLAAFVAAAAGALARRRPLPRTRAAVTRLARRAARAEHLVLVIVVVEGYLALTSSSNDGTGFVVPLLPCLIGLAVAATLSVPWGLLRVGLAAALVAVSAFNVVMKADVFAAVSRVRVVKVPGYVHVTVTNGEGYLQQNLAANAGYTLGPPTRWLSDREREWPRVYERIAAYLASRNRPWLYVDFVPNEPVLNTSSLRLYANRVGFVKADYAYVDTGGDDTVAAYRSFLVRTHPDVVMTATRSAWDFGPPQTPALVEAAARSLGYRPVARFRVPDGRTLRLWASRALESPG